MTASAPGAPRIMVDTNVWVDSYCGWHAGWRDARQFLRTALEADATLLVPVHCVKDVLYVVEGEFKRAAAREHGELGEDDAHAARQTALACARSMRDLATVVGVDGSDVWLADKYLRLHADFEDDLVLAACQRAGADFLVTRDKSLLAHADVSAKTPAQMTAILQL